ncbi:unnamed protein product [Macrosiphum euphorbiae]|uniref:Uncharacterized protein n=1 Tax=Macrosiphum euphorbiae TaxID=13131 RepID=A0AAV0XVR2_9HEMI|nr:unnamed protein product [Macrosiphum euphorbiae]
METVDLLTYNELVDRSVQKKMLFHLFADIYRTSHKADNNKRVADYYEKFGKILQKHANFLHEKNHVSTKSVAFVKSNITLLTVSLPLTTYRLLGS